MNMASNKENFAAIFLPASTSSPPLELSICHARLILNKHHLISLQYRSKKFSSQANLIGSYTGFLYHLQRQKLFHSYVPGCIPVCPYDSESPDYAEIYNIPISVLNSIHNGVMSSLASRLRITSFADIPRGFWTRHYYVLLREAIHIFLGTVSSIRKYNISILYSFNGRFFDSCAAVNAAKYCNIDFCVFDVNRSCSQYYFFNTSLHDIQANQNKAITHFSNISAQQLAQAHQYFTNRRNGKRTYEKSYTAGQTKSLLPDIPNGVTIISIFPSSDDEIRFLGESFNMQCVDQVTEISKLSDKLRDKPYILIVRMHPNMATMPQSVLQRYSELSALDNIILVKPLDSVDTYALLDVANIVVGFCSSIIIESAYSGRPTALIGPSPYLGLNMGNEFISGAQLGDFILQNMSFLRPDKSSSLMWASYIMSYNDYLPGFSIVNGVSYVDNKLVPSLRFYRLLASISKLLHEVVYDTSTLPLRLRAVSYFKRFKSLLRDRWSSI